MLRKINFIFVIFFLSLPQILFSQFLSDVDTSLISSVKYRELGPFRGGRSAAVTGISENPMLYYFGSTGGGVWKTTNGGQTWKNISDGFFGGSIGAVTVSESDNNVIYVGGGEVTIRGNVSHGNGVWKSTDAGKSWKNVGLKDSRFIPRIRIHPDNPDLVYVAALGHLYGPNEQRGVFRSKNGGKDWEKVLFVNNNVGAVDLIIDPVNPRIIYASTWNVKRTPFSLESGGEGSGLWKSTDSGDTWKNISRNKGLPKGTLGIIGITVSPVNNDRLWAIIEAIDGGVFRSDDGGESWTKINGERKLRQRAWYYSRIYADPNEIDKVYVLNVRFWISKDGGKSFKSIRTPHGDHHDFWVANENSNRMIIGDDGGAQISFDAGKSWSTYHNQPTAQIYRVTTDNHFPFRIYGAQQDNSTIRILSQSDGYSISEDDWESTSGGESGWIAPNPQNPDIVFGGSYGGYLTYYNHKTKEYRAVNVWPDNPMGHGAKDLKYRFQWNFPIIFSKHNLNDLYVGGNVLFKSTNFGESWLAISPDLTRNDTTKLKSSGGPITQDNTSVEYYCTIFTITESVYDEKVIWIGTDDGLVQLTKDSGKTWKNVTPETSLLPEWSQINSIEADPFNPGGLYVAATLYKSDDNKPYLFKTKDYGETWEKIVDGIDENHFTRVIRTDPNREGLLYTGTENGMYISFNDGENWQPFQSNLPIVPITDLAVKDKSLIVATQGRSFWIIDDLSVLHNISDDVINKSSFLFPISPSHRMRGGGGYSSLLNGTNKENAVIFNYYLNAKKDSSRIKLEILDSSEKLVKAFTGTDKNKRERLSFKKGMNKFKWNMRYPNAEKFKGLILWGGGLSGPKAVPGKYIARLIVDSDTLVSNFEILKDPRSTSSIEDMQAQFDFLIEIRDKLSEIHTGISRIRKVKKSVNLVLNKTKNLVDVDSVKFVGEKIKSTIDKIEANLYQTQNESSQDPLNFPIRLNNRLSSLASLTGSGDFAPTAQNIKVKGILFKLIDDELRKLENVELNLIPKFNDLVNEARIPAVSPKKENNKLEK